MTTSLPIGSGSGREKRRQGHGDEWNWKREGDRWGRTVWRDKRVRWPHCTPAFSLQGALQLRQDFGVVLELLEEERWGLSPELRQTLLMLSIFQRLDGALLCLLQQPLPKTRVHRRPPCCCESFPFLNSKLSWPLAQYFMCPIPYAHHLTGFSHPYPSAATRLYSCLTRCL